jgi:hypothetical protein
VRRALLLGAAVALVAPAAAAPADRLALFPSPLAPLTAIPPFQPPPTALANLFRAPIDSREVLDVGIDRDGRVVAVQATQRLEIHRPGDYRLTVPAPAEDVEAAPGSESSPGLRPGAILWQGFSPGNRVLAARATLDPARAREALPLRVELSDGTVRLENVTAARGSTYSADGNRDQLAHVLDTLRRDPDGTSLGQGAYVKVRGKTTAAEIEVVAPLHVTGRIGDAKVDLLLGGGRPRTRTVSVSRRPSLHLRVEPVPPDALLRPPRGRTWVQALRLGAVPDGRTLFARAAEASFTIARIRQYDAPLVNPDSLGTIGARYEYRTVAAPAPPPAPPSEDRGGLATWAVALIAAGAVAAAGGLAVLWAHS